MSIFDITLAVSAVCGILIVATSIALLYRERGEVQARPRNAELPRGNTLTITLANWLTLATTSPTLGLFLIALLFLALGLYFALPRTGPSIRFTGTTEQIYQGAAVTVTAEGQQFTSAAAGRQLMGTARPAPSDRIRIAVTAPGFVAAEQYIAMPHNDVLVDLHTVTLRRSDSRYSVPPEGSTDLPRPDASLPPPDRATFGRGSQP